METQVIVEHGELDRTRLDRATHYRSSRGTTYKVEKRTFCSRCQHTTSFYDMEGGTFVTFNAAHLSCARAG